MKRILCFGDSNTWGYIPGIGKRYTVEERWTRRLAAMLQDEYEVLEFGLNGCSSGFPEYAKSYETNGQILFPAVLESHLPADILILMLGTNDLKKYHGWKSGDTAGRIEKLIDYTEMVSPGTRIILAAPVKVTDEIANDPEYDEQAVVNSVLAAEEIKCLAREKSVPFFDTNGYVTEPGMDGCHFTKAGHAIFAEKMGALIHSLEK